MLFQFPTKIFSYIFRSKGASVSATYSQWFKEKKTREREGVRERKNAKANVVKCLELENLGK